MDPTHRKGLKERLDTNMRANWESGYAWVGWEKARGEAIRTRAAPATLPKTRRKGRQSLPWQKGYTALSLRPETMSDLLRGLTLVARAYPEGTKATTLQQHSLSVRLDSWKAQTVTEQTLLLSNPFQRRQLCLMKTVYSKAIPALKGKTDERGLEERC